MKPANQKWIPFIVGIGALTSVLLLWYSLLREEKADIERAVGMAAFAVNADYADHLNAQVLALVRMGKRWESQRGSPRSVWEADAEQYIKHYPGYKSILLVDPAYNVKWTVFLKDGGSVQSLDLHAKPELIKPLMEARERHDAVMSSPFEIRNGRGVLVAVPLLREGVSDGFIVGIFDVHDLLGNIWSLWSRSGYTIDVFSGGEEVYSSRSAKDRFGEEWSKEVELHLYTAAWRLRLSPTRDALNKIRSRLPMAVLAGGGLLTLLLSFVIYFAQISRTRYEEIKSINEELKQEIVARSEAEEELSESREQLRSLAVSQQRVREEERTRIARNIHDDLGQILTIFKFDLAWIRKRLGSDQEPLIDKINRTAELADNAMETVQRISSELRPTVLDDLGITAGIRWQAEEFQRRTGIRCSLAIESEEMDLDPELSTNIFRIFQEILTNVARHSEATRVDAIMRVANGMLSLEVTDDGRGITEGEISDPKSIGLTGIRERLYQFNGNVEVVGTQGRGTTVKVSVPAGRKGEKDDKCGNRGRPSHCS